MTEYQRQMWVTWMGAIGLKKVGLIDYLKVYDAIRCAPQPK